MASKPPINPLDMSDEDIMNMSAPPEVVADTPVETVVEEPEVKTEEEPKVETEEPVKEEPKQEDENESVVEEEKQEEPVKATETKEENPEIKSEEKTEEIKEKVAEEAPDYESFYTKIMTPFKANGKEIKLNNPEEAIKLMQMGANYTKKMQDIQPHRKKLLMLETNNLTEDDISYLIDLKNKDPEAIKKLIKDSGIDPLDIDTSVEPAYQEGNHKVSDLEAGFRTKLDEITSLPNGTETLKLINDWDQPSKDVLWDQPEIMAVIYEQKESGLYDRISTEVDRLRLLGEIPASVGFLQAYKIAGDKLFANAPKEVPVKQEEAPKAVVTTRVVTPKADVENNEQVSAASPSRSTPKKAETIVNPLSMSDDDFLKQFNGRL